LRETLDSGPIGHLLLGHDAGVEQTWRRQHTAECPDQDQDDAHLPTRRAAFQRMHNGDVSTGWQKADVPTHRLEVDGGELRVGVGEIGTHLSKLMATSVKTDVETVTLATKLLIVQ